MTDKNEQIIHDFKVKYGIFDLSYLSIASRRASIILTAFFYAVLISAIYYIMLQEKNSDFNLFLAGIIGVSIMSILVLFFMNSGVFFKDAIKSIVFSYGIALSWALLLFLCLLLFNWLSPFFESEYKIITVTDKFLVGIGGTCKAAFFCMVFFYILKYPYVICRDISKKHPGAVMAYKMQKKYENDGSSAKNVEEYIATNSFIWDKDVLS